MRRRGRCAQDVEYQRPVLLPLLPAASTHAPIQSSLCLTSPMHPWGQCALIILAPGIATVVVSRSKYA